MPNLWPCETVQTNPVARNHVLRITAYRDVTVTPRPEGRTALRDRAMWYVRLRLARVRRMRFPPQQRRAGRGRAERGR